jgi:hypothetical protein
VSLISVSLKQRLIGRTHSFAMLPLIGRT